MKNTFKYMLLLGAAALGFMACQQEEEADIQGVVGDFVYLVDGTEAEYAGPTCEIFHTPIGEQGEIKTTVTVALTRVQTSDVEVVLALDNESLSNNYEPFPAGVVKFQEKVTIPAGEKEKSIEVTVDNADFASLTEMNYQAIIRIATATVVKISSNSNAAYLMAVTETIDPADNVVSIPASSSTYDIKHYHAEDGTVNTVPADITRTITVSGTEEAFLPFEVVLEHDSDLVATYNEANGTAYLALPEGVALSITSPIIMEKDATSANAIVSISADDQKLLTDSKGYLVPIVLTEVGDATLSPNTGVVYLVITVKNVEGSANYFSSLYLGDYNMATWYMFQNPVDLSKGYTYIFHMFIDEFDSDNKMRIGDFADANEKWINMLRTGEKSNDKSLEWFAGPDGARVKLYTPQLEEKKWYHVVLRYDTNSYQLYLEQELVAEHVLTDEEKEKMKLCAGYPATFQAIEFNSSWGAGSRNGSAFLGRLWNVSVWSQAINPANLWATYRYIHSAFLTSSRYGLAAFWPMDEGDGYILREASGKYEAIDFSNTKRVDSEPMVSADVSQYVQWKNDSYNDFSGE